MTCQHNCYAHDTSDGGSISICRICGAQFDWAGKTLYAGNRSTEVTITRTRYEAYNALQSKLTTLLEAAEAVDAMATRYGSNDTSIDLFDLQTTINNLRAAVKKAREGVCEQETKT